MNIQSLSVRFNLEKFLQKERKLELEIYCSSEKRVGERARAREWERERVVSGVKNKTSGQVQETEDRKKC